MKSAVLAGLLCFTTVSGVYDPCVDPDPGFLAEDFPANFSWAVATSAYQYEGAWNLNGKGPSIMDKWYHEHPENLNGANGDVGCDGYHRWREDLQRIKFLNVSHYRLSFSWARLLPTGRLEDGINPDGIRYYQQIITDLSQNQIQPIVTLSHQDLPQSLEDTGGWLNAESADWFESYARFCFQQFGSQVKLWLSINQPIFTSFGYVGNVLAPGNPNGDPGRDPYIVTHNIIRAHTKAYHVYDREFRSAQKGQFGITVHMDAQIPKTQSAEDVAASERVSLFNQGRVLEPLFGIEGDYPPEMKERMEQLRVDEGTSQSRLPIFTEEEKQLNKGASDFIGLNLYGATVVSAVGKNESVTSNIPFLPSSVVAHFFPNPMTDMDGKVSRCPDWKLDLISFANVSWSFRVSLNWIKDRYRNPTVFITENGVSDGTGTLNDIERIGFYNGYVNGVLKSILNDGCNVVGFTVWTLLDDFEWTLGYNGKFGLFNVNFTDPSLPRTAKASAYWYRDLVSSNSMKNLKQSDSYLQIRESPNELTRNLESYSSMGEAEEAEGGGGNLGLVLGIGTVAIFVVALAGAMLLSQRQKKKMERHRLFSDPSVTTYRSF